MDITAGGARVGHQCESGHSQPRTRSPTKQLPTTTGRPQEAPLHRQAPATEGPDRLGAMVNETWDRQDTRRTKSPGTRLPAATERTQEAPPHRYAPATEGLDRIGTMMSDEPIPTRWRRDRHPTATKVLVGSAPSKRRSDRTWSIPRHNLLSAARELPEGRRWTPSPGEAELVARRDHMAPHSKTTSTSRHHPN